MLEGGKEVGRREQPGGGGGSHPATRSLLGGQLVWESTERKMLQAMKIISLRR